MQKLVEIETNDFKEQSLCFRLYVFVYICKCRLNSLIKLESIKIDYYDHCLDQFRFVDESQPNMTATFH